MFFRILVGQFHFSHRVVISMNRLLPALAFLLTITIAPAWAQPNYCIPDNKCGSSTGPYIAGIAFNSLLSTSTCNGYKLFAETGATTTTVERLAKYRATIKFHGTYII